MRAGRLSRVAVSCALAMASGWAHPAAALRPARHVRVALDISRSMNQNDPQRLATLATVLLHDLVEPNPGLGDSFEVIPFDPRWQWPDGQPPPSSTGQRIRAQQGRRESFARALATLPYDGRTTYFYPCLKAAVDDLERAQGGAADVKAVVLLTDGLPIASKRGAEADLIQRELLPRISRAGIRLYVVAFGPEAAGNAGYLRSLIQGNGAALGEAFIDRDGSGLLATMLQIFARSFGFAPDAPRKLSGAHLSLDLDAQTTPEKVAVVVFAKRPAPLPRLELTPPSGGTVNRQGEGVRSAAELGASFSLLWVLSPSPGDYRLDTDATGGSVAVLRPIRLILEVRPAPPHAQTGRAMAKTPFSLRVLVRNPTGAVGAPAPADLSYRPLGQRLSTAGGAGGESFSWQGEWSAPPPNAGIVTPEGRAYAIAPEFPENREAPGRMYVGHLEVRARSGEAVVGSLAGDHAHAVEIHPLLAIAPTPLSAYAAEHTLARGDEGCARFSLALRAGDLPHPENPGYPIQAVLAVADLAVLDRELREASFTLDGLPLEAAGRPAPQAGEWRRGRRLDGRELLGEHRLCLEVGRPAAGDPAVPVELTLAFTLREDPYDDFHVIEPFTLKAQIEPPGFVDRWRSSLLAGSILLVLLAAGWYLRDRPALPDDLGLAIGRDSGAAALPIPSGLGERSLASCLLGLADERPVIAPAEDRVLGRVAAENVALYQFRPARGVAVEATAEGDQLVRSGGAAMLGVHRIYRLRTSTGPYLIRLEYR